VYHRECYGSMPSPPAPLPKGEGSWTSNGESLCDLKEIGMMETELHLKAEIVGSEHLLDETVHVPADLLVPIIEEFIIQKANG
jgi:hypothetical protein